NAGDLDGELGVALVEASDCVGTFHIEAPGREPAIVDAYSNVIEDDCGTPAFRLVALVDVTAHEKVERDELEKRIREKDTLLREIQHRVKNNLQMITALIRLEARNVAGGAVTAPFDRLAGRLESVQLLIYSWSEDAGVVRIVLGVYLGKFPSPAMVHTGWGAFGL